MAKLSAILGGFCLEEAIDFSPGFQPGFNPGKHPSMTIRPEKGETFRGLIQADCPPEKE
jgi:hypothetical protein